MLKKPTRKSLEEVKIMHEGGRKLSKVKGELEKSIVPGVSALEIEDLATNLIKETGGLASFKMVPRYSWSTCINVNEGVVHGIPKKEIVFKKGDLVSIDVGLYYKGFHTDTSTTVAVDTRGKVKFLQVGKRALNLAIKKAKIGNKIGDISKVIENTLKNAGFEPIRALVGHGIGRELHEAPSIPCFISGARDESVILEEGIVLAIEVMYCQGKPDLAIDKDGWTIRTEDGKIAGLFEETVAVSKNGPIVLTR